MRALAAGPRDPVKTHLLYRPPRAEGSSGPGEEGHAPPPRFRAVYAAAGVLFLGVVSNVLWLVEVMTIKGWEGLAWLDGFPLAALPVCLCASAAALIPVLRRTRVGAPRAALFLAGATVASLTAFSVARIWFHAMNARFVPPPWWGLVLPPTFAVLTASGGFTLAARLLLAGNPRARVSGLFPALVALAVTGTNAVAYLTIQLLPAVNGDRDYIHCVKMGYPCFWVSVLLGSAMAASLRAPPRPTPPSMR